MVQCPSLEKVGLIFMTVVTFRAVCVLIRFFYRNVVRPKFKKKIKLKAMGQWAVVTGATEGLGRAYAFALAREGLDLLLISNSLKKLESVAAEIEAESRVRTSVLEADFSGGGDDVLQRLDEELSGREVGVLVNNVVATYPHPEYFLDLPHGERVYGAIIASNVLAVTHLTSMVLPGMVSRSRGVVINISSTAAIIPCPLLSVYAASKVYLKKFSQDLAQEYEKCGITIQCLTPGYVAAVSGHAKCSSWMVPTPERYVQSALGCIGLDTVTTAYFPHLVLVTAISCLENISSTLTGRAAVHGMEMIRRRALQRYAL